MGDTNIEYATKVWNPVTGCTPISAGCDNCWAQAYLKRFKQPTGIVLHPNRLEEPLKWRKPQTVFVVSQGDLFHDDVPFEFIAEIWDTIFNCQSDISSNPTHTFLVLTKRPKRMSEFARWMNDSQHRKTDYPNLWLGISVEDQSQEHRIETLLQIPASHYWLSYEPALGPLDVSPFVRGRVSRGAPDFVGDGPDDVGTHCCLPGLDWIVCGGESGSGARPMHPDWARKVRDDMAAAGMLDKFMFKQWGEWFPIGSDTTSRAGDRMLDYQGHYDRERDEFNLGDCKTIRRVGKKKAGRLLDGVVHDGRPGK